MVIRPGLWILLFGLFCVAAPANVAAQSPRLVLRPDAHVARPTPLREIAVDRNGSTVRFVRSPGDRWMLFSLSERLLRKSPTSEPRLHSALPESQGARILRTAEGQSVELYGKLLPSDLTQGDPPECLALHNESKTLLLGTDRSLVALQLQDSESKQAQLAFRIQTPGVLALNLSTDGRITIAAHEDGTLRFYSTRDGNLLLTLVVHADLARWVVYTPSGYYDASGPDVDLVGWSLQNGPVQAPDFFPLPLFAEHYHRPDLVGRVLFSQDERRTLQELNAEAGRKEAPTIDGLLPPIVSVLSPQDGTVLKSREVEVAVAVRSPSGQPIVRVRALVHGRQVQPRHLSVVQATWREQVESARLPKRVLLRVQIPPEDSTLAVLAETKAARSQPATVRLRFAKDPGRPEAPRPVLNILAVGVGRYPEREMRLRYPAKDAEDLVAAFRNQQGRLYRQINARVLTDEGATRGQILEGLSWLTRETTATDVALVFLAGHGINDTEDGRYYFLSHDSKVQNPAETMVNSQELQAALQSIRGKVLLFLDTCHAGNVLSPRQKRSLDLSRLAYDLASVESGVVVYTAATGNQTAVESPRWQNGAFTKALIEGLSGKADYRKSGRITVSALEQYVGERVRELTLDTQTPSTAKPSTVPDFLVATVPVKPPLHKRPWFWTTIGLSAAAVVAVSLGTALRPAPDEIYRPF